MEIMGLQTFYTSAKTGDCIDKPFAFLATEIMNHERTYTSSMVKNRKTI